MRGADLLFDRLVDAGGAVWRASWQASVLALLVLAVQLIVGKRLPARWRHAMWLLVLVRLALPVVPSSPLSVFNLTGVRPAQPAPRATLELAPTPEPHATRQSPLAVSQPDAASNAKPQATFAVPATDARDPWAGWPGVLATFWLAGTVLLALRVTWATIRVRRVVRQLTPITDGASLALLRRTAAELSVRRLPGLLTGEAFFSPALVGFLRPRLLVPQCLLDRFDAAELRLIFLHELAHLKRRDVAISWAATLLSALHWPNPVVWFVAWRLRIERELACDELVMSRTTDADRRVYGRTIVKLLETFARGREARPLPAGGVGILEDKHQMKRRIVMIAQFARSTRTWTLVAALLVLTLGLVALTDAVQAEAPEAPSPARADQATTTAHAPATRPASGGDEAIRIGELITVSVMNIAGDGIESVKTSRVDADGMLRLPLGYAVKAVGLTPIELERQVGAKWSGSQYGRVWSSVSLPQRGESHQLANRRAAAAAVDPAMMDAADPMALAIAQPAPSADPALQAALDRKLPEVKFDNVPLADVMDFLRDTTSTNVFVNWRALEEAGIDRAAPVSLNVRNVAFKDVLALVLKEQGGGVLQYGIENGVITVDATDAPAKARKLVTKAYDVRDLLSEGSGRGGMFGGEQGADSAKSLMMTIYETVSPESWRAQGGSGSLSAYGTKLIVTADEDIHRNVVSLLEMLRENPQPAAATTKPAVEAH